MNYNEIRRFVRVIRRDLARLDGRAATIRRLVEEVERRQLVQEQTRIQVARLVEENERLRGERDHWKRRAAELGESLDSDLEIRAAVGDWYTAWRGRSITAMKDANLRLRAAASEWFDPTNIADAAGGDT